MGQRTEVVLVNLINGARSEVCVKDDQVTGQTFVDHDDLLAWSQKTNCEQAVRDMWSGSGPIDRFIGFVDDKIEVVLLILRNKERLMHARTYDKIAFYAKRIPAFVYEHPNRIPQKERT